MTDAEEEYIPKPKTIVEKFRDLEYCVRKYSVGHIKKEKIHNTLKAVLPRIIRGAPMSALEPTVKALEYLGYISRMPGTTLMQAYYRVHKPQGLKSLHTYLVFQLEKDSNY